MNGVKQHRNPQIAPYVDGRSCDSASAATIQALDPSTGEVLYDLPRGTEADVDGAVSSGRSAFEDGRWCRASPSFRRLALQRWADLIEAAGDELDFLDAQDMGKPVAERFGDARAAAALVRFYAEAGDKLSGDTFAGDHGSLTAQLWIPRGVVGAIVAWNFPSYLVALKVAPALAAGNSVILKPSELSSRSALRMAELALSAGVPPGVFNVVLGEGARVGRALGMHMDVDMVSFTGSTPVGKQMLQYAGLSNLKTVHVECGGKSPQIVFDDGVRLTDVADGVARALLTNQGQICSVGSRLLVERSAQQPLLEMIIERLRAYRMGAATDPRTTLGPLASAAQARRVLAHIEGALRDGASLVAGGGRGSGASGGCFVEPTVFADVSAEMRLAREEVFGPVLAVLAFDDEAQAIRLANATTYGLAAYVWTADLGRGLRVAKALRTTVSVNAAAPSGEGAGFAAPSEPARESGIGVEGGLAGLASYMRRQTIRFNHA